MKRIIESTIYTSDDGTRCLLDCQFLDIEKSTAISPFAYVCRAYLKDKQTSTTQTGLVLEIVKGVRAYRERWIRPKCCIDASERVLKEHKELKALKGGDKMSVKKFEVSGKNTMYLVEIHNEEFLVYNGRGEEVGYGAVSQSCGVEWVNTDFNDCDFEALNTCLADYTNRWTGRG